MHQLVLKLNNLNTNYGLSKIQGCGYLHNYKNKRTHYMSSKWIQRVVGYLWSDCFSSALL